MQAPQSPSPECSATLDGRHHYARRSVARDERTGRELASYVVCLCGRIPLPDELYALASGEHAVSRLRRKPWPLRQR